MEWIRSEIIRPIRDSKTVKFRRYDKTTKSMAEVREIPENIIIIFEGIFTTGRLLGDYLDLRLWLDCPRETVLKRGEIRSGEPRAV
jgi:uridine kinase